MDFILLDACSFPLSVERIAKIWGQFVATCVERKAFQTSENKLHYQKLRKWIRCTCWIRVYCAIHPNKVFEVLLWVHLMGSYCIVHITASVSVYTCNLDVQIFSNYSPPHKISQKKPKIFISFSLSKQNPKTKTQCIIPFPLSNVLLKLATRIGERHIEVWWWKRDDTLKLLVLGSVLKGWNWCKF